MRTTTCACGRQRQLYRACRHCDYPQAPAPAGVNPEEPVVIDDIAAQPITATAEPEYQSLAGVLQHALNQAQAGKGRERHSDDKPFLDQPIMEIARMLGDTGGHTYQIMKKGQEANRMVRRGQHDAAIREYLGVINYAAAAILLIRELPEGII